MDFLDPKKQRRHKLLLLSGYLIMALIVAGATTILLYEAYGYGLGKGGSIIQNGLVYLSSQPNPATVTVSGQNQTKSTNTTLTLPEGIYHIELSRTDYRPWSRNIEVNGGSIESYTYPLLIPVKLTTSSVKNYTSQPQLAIQSPSRKWLVVLLPGSSNTFDLFDLSNPSLAPTTITLPPGIVSQSTTAQSWSLLAWSNDDQHALLQHQYNNGKTEYIMLDIADPSQSFNLSQSLTGVSFSSLTLDNQHYNQYYLYNSANQTLLQDNLSSANAPTTVLKNVLAYDTYGGNTILYATPNDAASGKINIDELIGSTNYHIKTLPSGTNYLLDIARYNGSVYVVASAASENKVYIYNNPVGQLQNDSDQAPVPVQVLLVNNPSYVSFSSNAQFVVAEGGQQFAVYNIENASGYNYQTNVPVDSPQTNATWMDSDRLTYVSGGKLIMFEYDRNYLQSLMPASPNYLPFFTPSYNYVYSLTPGANSGFDLTRTSLYTPTDQPQKL